jgi:hypothetical protein
MAHPELVCVAVAAREKRRGMTFKESPLAMRDRQRTDSMIEGRMDT